MRKTTADLLQVVLGLGAVALCASALAQVDRFQPGVAPADVAIVKQAQALRAQKKPDEAVAVLEPLVRRQPDYFSAQYELGLALSDTPSNIPKAVPVLEKAAELKRTRPEITDAHVLNSLGWAYMYTGNKGKAESTFKEAVERKDQLTPEVQKKLYNNLGYLYLNAGDPVRAEAYLRVAADTYGSTQAKANLDTLDALKKRKLAH